MAVDITFEANFVHLWLMFLWTVHFMMSLAYELRVLSHKFNLVPRVDEVGVKNTPNLQPILPQLYILLTLGAHAQGLRSLVCPSVCVCVSVCLSTLTLDLQATRRFTSGTNGISATRARKIMWQILLKCPHLRARNWHCRGHRCVAQPIN